MINSNKIKNIGIIAHIDAGKTTLSEKFLYTTGVKHNEGEVHDGNTTTDYLEVERARGITVVASCISMEWKDYIINLIDNPGHPDFIAEVDKSLRILDGIILVLSAKEGIQAQTRHLWIKKEKHKIPSLIFVNKMDIEGANFAKVLEAIEEQFNKTFLCLDIPLGSGKEFQGYYSIVHQKAFLFDLNKKDYEYTETELSKVKHLWNEDHLKIYKEHSFLYNEYKNDLVDMYRSNEISLVSCGTAFKNIGIHNMLDHIILFMPSPHCLPHKLVDVNNKSLNQSIFSGLIFKTTTSKFFGHLSAVRVYSGTIRKGDRIYNSSKKIREKVSRIVRMMADKTIDIEEAYSGDIVGLIGCKSSETRDSICADNHNIILDTIQFAEPILSQSVLLKDHSDQEKLSKALNAFVKEEGSFSYEIDNVTNQTVLHGMGDLHLQVLATRMMSDYNLEFTLTSPKVKYREAITKSVSEFGDHLKHAKQTGGRGEYAHIVINIRPITNQRFKFNNQIVGGKIPINFIETVHKTLLQCMENGILTNSPLWGVEVDLIDGSYHMVDSSDKAFATCTTNVFREILKDCESIILEPMVEMGIMSPNKFTGKITSDLLSSQKRGSIHDIKTGEKYSEIITIIPLSSTFNYVTSLKTITSGLAFIDYQNYSGFDVMPSHIKEKVIENMKK